MKVGVISLGAEMHARNFVGNVSKIIKNHEVTFVPLDQRSGYSGVQWSEYDALDNIGFFFNMDCFFSELKREYRELRIINTWIGTDILESRQFIASRPKCSKCLFQEIDLHIVDDVYQLGKELETWFGIKPRYVPSIPQKTYDLAPFPEVHLVAVYMPPHRKDFYQFPLILDLAKSHPSVPFKLYAVSDDDKGKKLESHPNIEFKGFVTGNEKDECWKKATIFISIPLHGGCSVTLIEALQLGRYAISQYPYPYMNDIYHFDDLLSFRHPREEASRYYRREYSPERQAQLFESALEELA